MRIVVEYIESALASDRVAHSARAISKTSLARTSLGTDAPDAPCASISVTRARSLTAHFWGKSVSVVWDKAGPENASVKHIAAVRTQSIAASMKKTDTVTAYASFRLFGVTTNTLRHVEIVTCLS